MSKREFAKSYRRTNIGPSLEVVYEENGKSVANIRCRWISKRLTVIRSYGR